MEEVLKWKVGLSCAGLICAWGKSSCIYSCLSLESGGGIFLLCLFQNLLSWLTTGQVLGISCGGWHTLQSRAASLVRWYQSRPAICLPSLCCNN